MRAPLSGRICEWETASPAARLRLTCRAELLQLRRWRTPSNSASGPSLCLKPALLTTLQWEGGTTGSRRPRSCCVSAAQCGFFFYRVGKWTERAGPCHPKRGLCCRASDDPHRSLCALCGLSSRGFFSPPRGASCARLRPRQRIVPGESRQVFSHGFSKMCI